MVPPSIPQHPAEQEVSPTTFFTQTQPGLPQVMQEVRGSAGIAESLSQYSGHAAICPQPYLKQLNYRWQQTAESDFQMSRWAQWVNP